MPSIIYPVACYAILRYLDISAKSLLPLFFPTPITYGSLSLSPSSIGAWLGLLGLTDGIFQLFFLAKLVDWMGPKWLFCRAIMYCVPLMLLFPLMSWIVQTRGSTSVSSHSACSARLTLSGIVSHMIHLAHPLDFSVCSCSSPRPRRPTMSWGSSMV